MPSRGKKSCAVKINNHDALALLVPEQVGLPQIVVGDAVKVDVLDGATLVRIPALALAGAASVRLATLRQEHHVANCRGVAWEVEAVPEVHEAEMDRYRLALERLELVVDVRFMQQAGLVGQLRPLGCQRVPVRG